MKTVSKDIAAQIGPFVPKIDENGYMEMQLWEVIHTFGPLISQGNPNLPFEMDIQIEENDLKEIKNNNKLR